MTPFGAGSARLAVVILSDRLAVAAVSGDRVETFSTAAENPVAMLRDELTRRQLTARIVALGLARSAAFVKPIELPTVGGDLREMVRLNLEGHLPFAASNAAFDWMPLAPDADTARPDEMLHRVLVVAAERRVVDSALRVAEEAKLRPGSLTVAVHNLLALARPARDQRVVWLHRTGATADILCLRGPSLVLSRTAPAADESTLGEEVRRSLAAVRWRACDAVWVSGDLDPANPALADLGLAVGEPDYLPRMQRRLAALGPEDRGAHMLALATATAGSVPPVDLLPMPLRPRRISRMQAITLGVAGVAAALLVTALLVPGIREQGQLGRVNEKIARLDPDVRTIERVQRELERKRKLLATINGIEANATRPLPVLRDLTDLLPSDTWLTNVSLGANGVELTGQAASASDLVPLLANSPRLERVELSPLVTHVRGKEQFSIRAAWKAGAQASPPIQPTQPGGVQPAPIQAPEKSKT